MVIAGLKIGGCIVSGVACCSLAANVWVAGEQRLKSEINNVRSAVVSAVASSEGYIKPVVLDPQNREETIKQAAKKHRISSAFVRAVMSVESAGKQTAISDKGAIGVMQVMPANAKRCGLNPRSLHNEDENIFCGAQILAEEFRAYNDGLKALVAYNGGPRAVSQLEKCGAVLPNGQLNKKCLGGYIESVLYAKKVVNQIVVN